MVDRSWATSLRHTAGGRDIQVNHKRAVRFKPRTVFLWLFLARAAARSSGVFTLYVSVERLRGGKTRAARSARANDWSESSFAASCRSTTGRQPAFIANGNPATPSTTVNAARRPFAARRSRRSNVAETNGMSHARNSSVSAWLVRNAVKMPPSGPQRGTRSRRTMRMGTPRGSAARRACASSVLRWSRSRALSRPIRALNPPARIATDTARLSWFGKTLTEKH